MASRSSKKYANIQPLEWRRGTPLSRRFGDSVHHLDDADPAHWRIQALRGIAWYRAADWQFMHDNEYYYQIGTLVARIIVHPEPQAALGSSAPGGPPIMSRNPKAQLSSSTTSSHDRTVSTTCQLRLKQQRETEKCGRNLNTELKLRCRQSHGGASALGVPKCSHG